jgi:hypothetical protein
MEVRPAKKEDWDYLIEIHKGHEFPFPDFKNMLDVLVVEDNGKIVAWGYTKKFVEIVFIPKVETPTITKVKSLKLLSEKSTELTKARGIDMVHSFVTDDKFARLLVERFNYGVCTGTPLFLDLDDNGEKR